MPFLVEDNRFLDEPPVNKTLAKENGMDYNNQQHMYTLNQPKTYDVLAEFRAVLDSYTKQGGPTRYKYVRKIPLFHYISFQNLALFTEYFYQKGIPISDIQFSIMEHLRSPYRRYLSIYT